MCVLTLGFSKYPKCYNVWLLAVFFNTRCPLLLIVQMLIKILCPKTKKVPQCTLYATNNLSNYLNGMGVCNCPHHTQLRRCKRNKFCMHKSCSTLPPHPLNKVQLRLVYRAKLLTRIFVRSSSASCLSLSISDMADVLCIDGTARRQKSSCWRVWVFTWLWALRSPLLSTQLVLAPLAKFACFFERCEKVTFLCRETPVAVKNLLTTWALFGAKVRGYRHTSLFGMF